MREVVSWLDGWLLGEVCICVKGGLLPWLKGGLLPLLVSNKWAEQAQGERPYQLVYFRDISQTTGQHCTEQVGLKTSSLALISTSSYINYFLCFIYRVVHFKLHSEIYQMLTCAPNFNLRTSINLMQSNLICG